MKLARRDIIYAVKVKAHEAFDLGKQTKRSNKRSGQLISRSPFL